MPRSRLTSPASSAIKRIVTTWKSSSASRSPHGSFLKAGSDQSITSLMECSAPVTANQCAELPPSRRSNLPSLTSLVGQFPPPNDVRCDGSFLRKQPPRPGRSLSPRAREGSAPCCRARCHRGPCARRGHSTRSRWRGTWLRRPIVAARATSMKSGDRRVATNRIASSCSASMA
jgi:hypothetical protein